MLLEAVLTLALASAIDAKSAQCPPKTCQPSNVYSSLKHGSHASDISAFCTSLIDPTYTTTVFYTPSPSTYTQEVSVTDVISSTVVQTEISVQTLSSVEATQTSIVPVTDTIESTQVLVQTVTAVEDLTTTVATQEIFITETTTIESDQTQTVTDVIVSTTIVPVTDTTIYTSRFLVTPPSRKRDVKPGENALLEQFVSSKLSSACSCIIGTGTTHTSTVVETATAQAETITQTQTDLLTTLITKTSVEVSSDIISETTTLYATSQTSETVVQTVLSSTTVTQISEILETDTVYSTAFQTSVEYETFVTTDSEYTTVAAASTTVIVISTVVTEIVTPCTDLSCPYTAASGNTYEFRCNQNFGYNDGNGCLTIDTVGDVSFEDCMNVCDTNGDCIAVQYFASGSYCNLCNGYDDNLMGGDGVDIAALSVYGL